MSDVFFSGLHVVRKVFMTNCFDEEVSELLTGEILPRDKMLKGRMSSVDKYLSIGTRNNWPYLRLKEMLRVSGIDGLQFLIGETYTHQHKEVTKVDGKVVWEETVRYTVLNPDYDKVTSSIKQLEQWCLSNREVAAELLDVYPQDMANSIESAFFTLDPNNEGFDGGHGAEFTFSVLKTVGELMRYAKFQRCWSVYRAPPHDF